MSEYRILKICDNCEGSKEIIVKMGDFNIVSRCPECEGFGGVMVELMDVLKKIRIQVPIHSNTETAILYQDWHIPSDAEIIFDA